MKTQKKTKSKLFKIILISLIILVCVFGIAFLIRNSKKSENLDNQTFMVRKEVFENIFRMMW